eukprot:7437335-Pyramimonas_sp.AAC.1
MFCEGWKSTKACDRCGAVAPNLRVDMSLAYSSFNDSAPNLATIRTHEQYMATCQQISPQSVVPGWRLELC